MKSLIITADDFGPVKGINNGIFKAIEEGKITSVASFVNFENDQTIVNKAKIIFETYNIEVGLHITITSGSPISKTSLIPNLVDKNGEFYDVKKIPIQNVTKNEIKLELEAQYNKFISLYGYKPLHLSNHHGILDLIPDIYETYLEFCQEKDIPKRSAKIIPSFNKSLYYSFFVSDSFRDKYKGFYHFIRTLKDEDVINYYRNKYSKIDSPSYLDSRFFKMRNKKSLHSSLKKITDYQTNEIMLHLFDGNINETYNYQGIDKEYFKGRKKELECLLESRFFDLVLKKPTLYNLGSWETL
jgi:predicted glycoside hydrolase/deacetylase ChbG (UPF0249 family)